MNSQESMSPGFVRLEWMLVAVIVALSAAVARYGTEKFHYGALGFAGLLLASVMALGLLILAFCILLGMVDVFMHKRRMRAKAEKATLPRGK